MTCPRHNKYWIIFKSIFRENLQAIVDGVDRSLGGLNNFKVTFEDKSQTLRVIDLNYVPEKICLLNFKPTKNTIVSIFSIAATLSGLSCTQNYLC